MATLETYDPIVEAIRTTLAEVFDGRIHTYQRWTPDMDEMMLLYRPEGAEAGGPLKAAVITLDSDMPMGESTMRTGDVRADLRKHTYAIEITYGWSDADASSVTVRNLVKAIIAHFDSWDVRTRFHEIDTVLHPMSAPSILIAQSKAGGVLFHAVRLVLPVIEL